MGIPLFSAARGGRVERRTRYPFLPHQGAPQGGPLPHAVGSVCAAVIGAAGRLSFRSTLGLEHFGQVTFAISDSLRTSVSNGSWHSWQSKS